VKFHRGEIWLVNFDPSFGHEYQKIRPALVIQHEKYINAGSLLTVIPISSQVNGIEELDVFITANF
jgi:mRNA interferase MazF